MVKRKDFVSYRSMLEHTYQQLNCNFIACHVSSLVPIKITCKIKYLHFYLYVRVYCSGLFVLNKYCNFKCWSPFMMVLTGKLKYLEENLSHMDWPGLKALKAQVPCQANLFGIHGR